MHKVKFQMWPLIDMIALWVLHWRLHFSSERMRISEVPSKIFKGATYSAMAEPGEIHANSSTELVHSTQRQSVCSSPSIIQSCNAFLVTAQVLQWYALRVARACVRIVKWQRLLHNCRRRSMQPDWVDSLCLQTGGSLQAGERDNILFLKVKLVVSS